MIQLLLDQTEELLEKWKHPDPYRPPTAPGGSKYERNLPCPNLDRKLHSARESYTRANSDNSTSANASVSEESGERASQCIYGIAVRHKRDTWKTTFTLSAKAGATLCIYN